MVHLVKNVQPKILADNADKWTKEYLDCIARGVKPSKTLATAYNKPEIKKALEEETHGKCAYCESKVKHISPGDIEHILPKNKNARPDLCFVWDNLTFACEDCNRSGKHDYYEPDLPLINPYVDYPENHFKAFGPMVQEKLGDSRAYATRATLDLNRTPLMEKRVERIESVKTLLTVWATIPESDPLKKVSEKELHKEYGKDKEFSFVIKYYLDGMGFPVINESI
jgi:5-methylcytosine-specific restriction endonuclease McrA